MRIPLSPSPNRVGVIKRTETSAQEIRESWNTWVASRCPRQDPPKVTERVRLLNNLKPYTPRWEE